MLDLAAVAVLHAREHEPAVVGGLELGLRDAREVLAQLVRVVRTVGAELVEVDLLEEVQVRLGGLAMPGVAGVAET